MALPKLNENPKYEIVIPSSGQKVKFRPYLVKEEKILLLAAESQDGGQTLNAIADTVVACIHDDIDKNALTTFDIEYLFLKIRSKSVGERAPILVTCSNEECKHQNEYTVDVESIKLDAKKTDFKIQLTNEVWVKMKWPSYTAVSQDEHLLKSESRTIQAFNLVVQCIDSIMTEDASYKIKETPHEEVVDFLESLTNDQYKKISDYMESIPSLTHTIEFDCTKCGTHNKQKLEGISDFF